MQVDLESVGGRFELVSVNAARIKNVPGRKTDMRIASGSRTSCGTGD